MSAVNSDSVRAGASGVTAAYTIEQSCRFNDDDGAVLQKTPRIAGNSRTFTISVWFKRCNFDSIMMMYSADSASGIDVLRFEADGGLSIIMEAANGAVIGQLDTTRLFRDCSAWYHLVYVWDTTNATAGDRMRLYINGVEETAFDIDTNPALNVASAGFNAEVPHAWGHEETTGNRHWDGYLADAHFIDGAALAASNFGETDDQGNWVPKEYDVSISTTAEDKSAGSSITSAVSTTNATDYSGSFDGHAIGTASASRRVYCWVTGQGTTIALRTLSSMTIGGVSASLVQHAESAEAQYISEMWEANVPSGTTADIDIVWNAAMSNCGIITWSVTGDHYVSAVATDLSNSTSSVTVPIPANSYVIAAYGGNAGSTMTWSSAVTEDIDQVVEGTVTHHGASLAHTTATTTTITATPSGSNDRPRMMAIVLSPTQAYGTNGHRLDFANSGHFGLDVQATDTTTDTPSASGDWSGSTSQFTFSGDDVVWAGPGSKAIYNSGNSLSGDFIIEWLDAGMVDSNYVSCGIGIFAADEVGTFNGSDNEGDMPAMTNSWHIDQAGAGEDTYYGSAKQADTNFTSGGIIRITRDGGVIRFWDDWSLIHKFTQTYTDAVYFCIGGNHADQDLDNISLITGINLNSYNDTGLATNDQVLDSPTDDADNNIGNYPVIDSASYGALVTISDGGLVATGNSSGNNGEYFATMAAPLTGKFYWEVTINTLDSSTTYPKTGVAGRNFNHLAVTNSGASQDGSGNGISLGGGDRILLGATSSSLVTAKSASDVEGWALDMDNGALYFRINTTWQTSGDPTSGASKTGAVWTWTPDNLIQRTPAGTEYNSSVTTWNFGQHAFAQAIPAGYTRLYSPEFSTPDVKDPSKFFQVDLFTGTGAELALTLTDAGGSAVKPDLVWVKDRDTTVQHVLTDSARGATKEINCDATAEETTVAQGLKSFDTSGYTLGTDGNYNTSSSLNLAYCWNSQGGAGSSNTDGTINTTTTSVGTTQGFSISTYVGTGSAATVGHGLGAAPECIWVKSRNQVDSWKTYHAVQGPHTVGTESGADDPETDHMSLNSTIAFADAAGNWNDTAPTSTVFSVGTDAGTNGSTDTMLAYCWVGVEGYSKFGGYTGNGNADGPFVWCGFRPKMIIVKGNDLAQGWTIMNVESSPFNVMDDYIRIDNTDGETTATSRNLDILSNGFKPRTTDNALNGSLNDYIFMAWAEVPFAGDGVSQARAR